MIPLYDIRHPMCAGKQSAKPANAKSSKRPRDQAGPSSSGTEMDPVSLPVEVWQKVIAWSQDSDMAQILKCETEYLLVGCHMMTRKACILIWACKGLPTHI